VREHVFVPDSNHKGNVAEAEIAAAAVNLGIPVLKPVAEHGRYDLAFELGNKLHRVQCKWGGLDADRTVVVVRIGGSWLSPNGYVKTSYEENEIDLLAVYCGELDCCYLLPARMVAGMRGIHLRLTAPLNSQRASINLASDYEFTGAIAQLGERLTGSQEVVGSSPTGSTPMDSAVRQVGAHEFRNHFGYYMERAAAGEKILITRRGKPHARLGPPAASQPELDLAPSTTRPGLRPARSPSSDTPRTG
jgi:prevent-host-death family protein